MDKQSDQRQTSEEKGEFRGERGREEARQGRVWVRKTMEHSKPPVATHKPPFIHRGRGARETPGMKSSKMVP